MTGMVASTGQGRLHKAAKLGLYNRRAFRERERVVVEEEVDECRSKCRVCKFTSKLTSGIFSWVDGWRIRLS